MYQLLINIVKNLSIFLPLFFITILIKTGYSDEEGSGAVYLWKPEEYPSLTANPKYCTGNLRNPPTYVCDPDGILTAAEAQDLDILIDLGRNKSVCVCNSCLTNDNSYGLLIRVALVRSVESILNFTYEKTVEHFAEQTRLKWNLAKLCHNDVLVAVVTTYNKAYISMGSKAERIIGGERVASEIIQSAQKNFSYNLVYQGLETIILGLQNRAQSYDPSLDRLGLRKSFFIWILAGFLLIMIIVAGIWLTLKLETKSNKSQKLKPTNNNPNSKEYQVVDPEISS